MLNRLFITATLTVILLSCKSPKTPETLTGLWQVMKVEVGSEIMTPQERWTYLHEDSSQNSGNGWRQHSEGTWSIPGTGLIALKNSNGINDPYAPFHYTLTGDSMYWSRLEEGDSVHVYWKRIDRIPRSASDQLLGLWDLKSASLGNDDQTSAYDPEGKRHLFIRWDNRFRDAISRDSSVHGYYQTHGHRPQITFIQDGGKMNSYRFAVNDDLLELREVSEKTDPALTLKFQRIHEFPEF